MKTLEEFKKYIGELMNDAGDACQSSEGTSGCDEANFYQEILKEIKVFESLNREYI